MGRILAKVMRLGVALGVAFTIAGVGMELGGLRVLGEKVTILGVLTVLCTPIATLATLTLENTRKNPRLAALAVATIAAMMLSVAVSMIR